MYTKQSKKMLALNILEILRRYTDAEHCLSQKQIEEILQKDYDMVVDRKSIKRNILDLMDMGIDIQCSERTRMVYCRDSGEMEEQSVCTGFYLQRDIMDCEIQFLIDSVLGADYIAEQQKEQLIEKLEGLTSVHFRKASGMRKLRKDGTVKNQLFYSLEIIREAIANHKMVRFLYKGYRIGSGGVQASFSEHVVIPIDTEICGGKYLLYCENASGKEETYQIDYITEMRPIKTSGVRKYWNRVNHLGTERIVVFRAHEEMIPSFVDSFGENSLKFGRMEDEWIQVVVRTSDDRALEYALRNAMDTTILEPKALRDRAADALRRGLDGYNNSSFGRVG